MSLEAYRKTQTVTEKPRDTEFRLFGEVTGALLDAERDGGKDIQKRIKAVDWNRRMWSVFAGDCSSSENQLPETTRAQIVSLSIWVTKYSSQAMRQRLSLEPLIDINRTIMQGLSGE